MMRRIKAWALPGFSSLATWSIAAPAPRNGEVPGAVIVRRRVAKSSAFGLVIPRAPSARIRPGDARCLPN